MIRRWLINLLGLRENLEVYKNLYEQEREERLQLQAVLLELVQQKSIEPKLVQETNENIKAVGTRPNWPHLRKALEKKFRDTNSEQIMKVHKEQVEKDIAAGRLAPEQPNAS